VCAAPAQLPRIGDINFYGLRKFTPNEILAAARVGNGDSLPASRVVLEDRITQLPDVMEAQVQSICCEADHTTLFIGIRERDSPEIDFHPAPEGKETLPEELMTHYRQYQGALLRSEAAAIRRDQEYFRTYAASHTARLGAVLHDAADEEHRAAAAAILEFSASKKTAADDLLSALLDADETVRANAMRALAAIADVARREPALGIRISPSGFVDLLNSVVLSDRMEAVKVLLVLTERPNAAAIDLIRERALPALAEMARWHTRSYALPPFQLLGRVAGLPDAQVNPSWDKNERETVIQKALDSAPHRPDPGPPR